MKASQNTLACSSNSPDKTDLTAAKAIANERRSVPSSLAKVIMAFTAAAAMPVLYLNGSAYREGYLDELGLLPSMFSLDTAGTLTQGVVAWYMALTNGFAWLASFISDYAWPILLVFITSSILIGTLMYKAKASVQKLPSKAGSQPASKLRRWWSQVWKSALLIYLSGYSFIIIIFSLILLISVLVLPFLYVGKSAAQEDLANRYERSPAVIVQNAEGSRLEYRLIMCATSFCALYSHREIATVPISAINFAISSQKQQRGTLTTPADTGDSPPPAS